MEKRSVLGVEMAVNHVGTIEQAPYLYSKAFGGLTYILIETRPDLAYFLANQLSFVSRAHQHAVLLLSLY